MAFNFIKKVFSFGKDKEDAPAPAEAEKPAAPSAETADGASATGDAAPGQAFPQDSAMQFTPETVPGETPATPEPADEDHAGEPPVPGERKTADEAKDETENHVVDGQAADAEAQEWVAPEDLTTDPAASPVPEQPEMPETATAETPAAAPGKAVPGDGGLQFTPETAAGEPLATPAPVNEDHTGEPPVAAADSKSDDAGNTGAADDEGIPPEELVSDPDITPAPVDPAASEPASAPRRLVIRDSVSDAAPVQAPAPVEEGKGNWWQRLRKGLSRTSGQLTGQITGIFTKRRLDEDTLEELEDILLQADLGVETAMRITDALSSSRYGKDISPAEVQKVMAGEITRVLGPVAKPLELDLSHKPHVILVVGVNGTGKTTTIGKLAAKLSAGGLKVTLAAGDTFRAAAIEQLKIWGERTGSKVVSTKLGADAAGLAYEAFETARTDGADVLIIDTAGRLQNRTELMDELAKVVRVIGKLDPDAPHTVLQTLDATTGQNALNQVEIFRNVAGVNGLVMTKLDGTARGGILVAIAAKHKLPVYFVGVGEGVDDLEPFEAADFASAIAGQPAGDLT
ncbi:signal recognition particle-docking protein FtsY [Hoeflea halophila]|uniref:Signal recognition particle receptor FtsY n=1 Tax=Hoeflea halophila TaxID=714899 RepID=A0A286I9Q4_9HYPH|nr:signal recognition particle-docking protein FtsY [Hoeflea halophila]SOE16845.1 signal recognition particle-docking protein FtsY [Hoeflea halophila]